MERTNIWYFERVKLFKLICPIKFSEYKHSHTIKKYNKGDFVYFTGDPSTSLYLISNGKVKIMRYLESGEEVVKGILTRGDIFGELAILGENNRTDFAQALLNNTYICHMDVELLQKLMLDNKELALNIHKLIGLRIVKLERRLDALIFKDVRSRILDLLKEMIESLDPQHDGTYLIRHYYTHKDIADLVGTSRQTVTTIFNDMRNQGIIDFSRKEIHLLDPAALG